MDLSSRSVRRESALRSSRSFETNIFSSIARSSLCLRIAGRRKAQFQYLYLSLQVPAEGKVDEGPAEGRNAKHSRDVCSSRSTRSMEFYAGGHAEMCRTPVLDRYGSLPFASCDPAPQTLSTSIRAAETYIQSVCTKSGEFDSATTCLRAQALELPFASRARAFRLQLTSQPGGTSQAGVVAAGLGKNTRRQRSSSGMTAEGRERVDCQPI